MPVVEKSSSMGGDACSREALLSPGSQQDDTVIPRDTVSAGEAAYSRETLLTPFTPGAEGDDVVTVRDTASTNDDAYSRETLLNPLTPGSQQDDDVTMTNLLGPSVLCSIAGVGLESGNDPLQMATKRVKNHWLESPP
jgi:hypothetical protein